jgi:hypothetical protein
MLKCAHLVHSSESDNKALSSIAVLYKCKCTEVLNKVSQAAVHSTLRNEDDKSNITESRNKNFMILL